MAIVAALMSVLFFSKMLPVESACSVIGKVRTPEIVNAESSLDLVSKKINLVVKIDRAVDDEDPNYVVVVLSENNLATTKFAAIYGSQSSAGQMVSSFELAKLGKNASGNYVIPGIETKHLSTFVASVFGYKCDPTVSMNVSKLSIYQDGGVLERTSSQDKSMSVFAYSLSDPGKGLITNPAPSSTRTIDGVVAFSKSACGSECELIFNFSRYYKYEFTPGPVNKKFPLNSYGLSRLLETSRPSDSVFQFEHGDFYYFYYQFSAENFPEGLFVSLGRKDGSVAGVTVKSGLSQSLVPSKESVFESSVDELVRLILAQTGTYDNVLLDGNYLNAKFMAFFLLQANVVALGELGDVVSQFSSLPTLSSKTTNDDRFFELWKFAVNRNMGSLEDGFANFERVVDVQVELTSGVYSRIALLPSSLSGKSAHIPSEKMNVSHSNNVGLYYRDKKGAFCAIGGNGYRTTDPTWEAEASSQSDFMSYSFDRGSVTWNSILDGGLWARPIEGVSMKDQSLDERHYSVIVSRTGAKNARSRFSGTINSKSLIKVSDQLKKSYPKDADFLQYLPDDFKFRLISDETYSYSVDAGALPGFVNPKIKCFDGCIPNLLADLSVSRLNIHVPPLTQSASQQYWISSDQKVETGKVKGSIVKYVHDVPLMIYPSHQYIVTGYGGAGDAAEKMMEGLAELYAKTIVSSGGKPEVIRIRPLFGKKLRDIEISESGTAMAKGYGVSFLELNRLLSSGITREISFFGHGSAAGLWLGKLESGEHLGFFDGLKIDTKGTVPDFLGKFDPVARINLFQCYGAAYWIKGYSAGNKPIEVPYTMKAVHEYGEPIAKRLAEKWRVPVIGFNWLAVAEYPKKTIDGKYMYGLSSIKEGQSISSSTSITGYDSKNGAILYPWYQLPADVSEYQIDPKNSTAAVRNKGSIPSSLALQAGPLPLSTSLDCLRGGSCAW